jgi:hypothetical protein
MPTARAHSDEPRALEFEVYDYVFYDRASADGPLFGVFVICIHVPIFEGFEAGPEADFIVPRRIVRVCPPGEMQETGQRLQMMPYTREDQLEPTSPQGGRTKTAPVHDNCQKNVRPARLLGAPAFDR